jgi:hypothetical protein
MMDDDQQDQNVGFQDPDQEDMPSEMKDHWLAAFGHAAGQNPHPGKYQGPTRRKKVDPDDPTESELDNARQQEANASKMHAAQTGAPEAAAQSLGPSAMDQAAIKQGQALSKRSDTQAAMQAQQAQGAQTPVNAPQAPAGPQGFTIPFPAQKGAVGGAGNLQQPSQGAAPPAAPGPGGPPPDQNDEEQGPPQ